MLVHAPQVVRILYEDLRDSACDLSSQLQEAFGPDGLGLLLVQGVPDLASKRHEALSLAPKLAARTSFIRHSRPCCAWRVFYKTS
jgi:hypothetical protein